MFTRSEPAVRFGGSAGVPPPRSEPAARVGDRRALPPTMRRLFLPAFLPSGFSGGVQIGSIRL
ncbi:MAG: hypothetical protein HSCHL_0254 [Hydrogenibacillus schlegelii]|uniref:Uncharacterized protein n=1 Tax=Hydrogenibacillus schlegelii TaxID=1484 RepID=A0A2T5GDU5_HYDSH|nr:MAG: hypothetical protein HSCHL_0254 [Hydrogenibacillus schlegelii]